MRQPRSRSGPNPVTWVAATAAMAVAALVGVGQLAWVITKDDNIANAASEIAFVATLVLGWVGWLFANERPEQATSPVEDRHEAAIRRSCELEIEAYGSVVSPSLLAWWTDHGARQQPPSGS